MRVAAGNKAHGRNATRIAKRHAIGVGGRRMRDVPNVEVDEEFVQGPEAPFAEGAIDTLGAELCHRIVRDLADGWHGEGIEGDGSDSDDWLQAEADGAHLLRPRGR